MSCTGIWDGDPEFAGSGLVAQAYESVTHTKTNSSVTSFSRLGSKYLMNRFTWCPNGTNSSTYFECTSTNGTYSETCELAGDLQDDWYFRVDPPPSPIETPLSCGTLTTSPFWSQQVALNPDGNAGGACGRVPNIIFVVSGSLYQIDLELTPECNNNSIDESPSSSASSFSYSPSNSSLTSDNTHTSSSNSFEFTFNGESNSQHTVEYSTNLIDWIATTNITLTSNSFPLSFTIASNSTQGFYCVHNDTNSSSVVGFLKLPLTTNGNLIANPFVNSTNFQIGQLFSNVPNGTTIKFWGRTNWDRMATFSSNTWDHPEWQLLPGMGAFIQVSTNTTVELVGQIIQGAITNEIPVGISVRSSMFPQATNIIELGLTLTNGDYIQKWNGTGYDSYTNVAGSWLPSIPSVTIGEAFIVHASTASKWGSVLHAFDIYTLASPYIEYIPIGDDGPGIWMDEWSNSGWPDAIAPAGAVYEFYEVGETVIYTIPVTSSSLAGFEAFDFPENYQPSQGASIKLRYRNGNVYGPWSNECELP